MHSAGFSRKVLLLDKIGVKRKQIIGEERQYEKVVSLFLALTISLSLCACGSGGEAQEFVDYSKMELKSEEVASLNAENFDAEVEEIMISLTEQGIELSKKMVGTLLLYCNMTDITEDDHNAIFIDSITEVT